jgi:hypothetical protein
LRRLRRLLLLGITMSAAVGPVCCGCCGEVLDESCTLSLVNRAPCPMCGSLSRKYDVQVTATVVVRSKLGLKQKRPGVKKPIYEQVSGDDLHRKTGLWSRLLRVIDRLGNRYREEIFNSDTGEILRSVDEPLTEHRDRGSAKRLSKDA